MQNIIMVEYVKGPLLLAHPQFLLLVEKKVLREVIDTEGRVFEPLECGHQ
jgi:hypothetical protein